MHWIPCRALFEQAKKIFANEFVRGLVLTITNRGLLIVLGMASSIMVARGLGPEARGEYAYITALLAMVGQFSLLGMHSANVVFASRNPKDGGALLGNSLLTVACLGVLVCSGLFGFDTYVKGGMFAPLLPFLFAAVFLQTAVSLLQQLALGLGNLKAYNLTELLPACITPVCIAAIFFLDTLTIPFLLGLGVVTASFGLYVAIRGTWLKLCPKTICLDFRLFRQCLQYGWRVYVACILAFFLTRAEIFLAQDTISNAALGQFAMALGVFYMTLIPAQVLGNLLLSKLSSLPDEQKGKALLRVLLYVLPLLLLLVILLYVMCPYIFAFLYGEEYLDSIVLFKILLVGYIPASLSSILSSYISSWDLPLFSLFAYMVLCALKFLVFIFYAPLDTLNMSLVHSVFHFFIASFIIYLSIKRYKSTFATH